MWCYFRGVLLRGDLKGWFSPFCVQNAGRHLYPLSVYATLSEFLLALFLGNTPKSSIIFATVHNTLIIFLVRILKCAPLPSNSITAEKGAFKRSQSRTNYSRHQSKNYYEFWSNFLFETCWRVFFLFGDSFCLARPGVRRYSISLKKRPNSTSQYAV